MSSASVKIARLNDRAAMLRQSRQFFYDQNICEVDCPLLTQGASVDLHIDLIPAYYHGKEKRYLHSSPEYGMKRLLAEGMGDIFQLAHVFRDDEFGIKHNPEFMMAEWYRLGFTIDEMIKDTVEFIRLFLGDLPFCVVSYRETFLHFLGLDYLSLSEDELFNYLLENNIPYYPSIKEEGKDALLNLILSTCIEPKLGQSGLYVLIDYPATQCALAQKRNRGEEEVAERFEIYYQGIELANGYHELTDGAEQNSRFIETNLARVKWGKEPLPIDHLFLEALHKGLPDCCGVAVGFDRLMMLRHHAGKLAEVLSWDWEKA